MVNLLGVCNRRWCGWCNELSDNTAWNRFWGFTVAEPKECWTLRKRVGIWWSFNVWDRWLPVWKLARIWHEHSHKENDR